MSFNQSTDLAVAEPIAKNATSKAKRVSQMAGAAVLSFGLMGTFSIPAYATAGPVEGRPDGMAAVQQSLETVDADVAPLELIAPDGAVDSAVLEQERLKAEAEAKAAEEAAAAAAAEKVSPKVADIPAGVGAQGLVNAALAQLGTSQDCTDLVQNALAAIGATQRRDQGGYDHGVGDFYQYGTVVTSGDYAPGDILVWGGHVAIYIGNGDAVHGGWNGLNTEVAPAFTYTGAPAAVVRLG